MFELVKEGDKWVIKEGPPKRADLVAVVRCKDCKYSYDGVDSWCCSYGVCAGCIVPGDFYCKCGERKEKE